MPILLICPAFVATTLSITCLTYLAVHEHDRSNPRTLSELGTAHAKALTYFRWVLVVCGTLFAVTMFWFVIPKVHYNLALLVAWIVYYGDELLLAAVPARGTWQLRLHNIFGYAMSVGMLATVVIFITSFHGVVSWLEVMGLVIMAVVGAMTLIDRKRYIVYELAFIYTSHVTILVAALALA